MPDTITAPQRRPPVEHLLPVMVRLQAHLDSDLSLHEMARHADLSDYHFHRLFREFTGETPKQYLLRLRLERAAYRLLVYTDTILRIALDCGFRNHETFTRAFRKWAGVSPRTYRQQQKATQRRRSRRALREAFQDVGTHFEISDTTIRELSDLPIAFIRVIGPYEEVGTEPWSRLRTWLDHQPWSDPDPLFIGVALDAPGITPADRLRFDIAVRVPGPIEPTGDIGFQRLRGGTFGVTTHVGPFSTLEHAYRIAIDRLNRMPGRQVMGLPFVEIYRDAAVNEDITLHQTDLLIPVS